jgi:putative membrane protein|tara:strand:+ start:1334 stop:3076 length:1743 start_codon:yes stop_codon:yes gene_type:complete
MSEQDDVSKIQKRYSLTLLNPSSHYISLVISIAVAGVMAAFVSVTYLNSGDVIFPVLSVVGVLVGTQFLDILFSRHKEYSKSLHVSLFGNGLFFVSTLIGFGAMMLFAKDNLDLFYVTIGMFVFASFRIGIFTTILGASLKKAWGVAFIQPVAMYLVLIPPTMWIDSLTNPMALLFGAAFLGLATGWSYFTDRAGRPAVDSTHELIQAYVTSASKNDPTEMEQIIERKAKPSTVSTTQIKFQSNDKQVMFSMVLPDIHPGPFHPVGGSNIPYLIYKNMDSTAMVMHSISNHDLNLPSQEEVNNYLTSISDSEVLRNGVGCTEPVTVQINNARAGGLLFDKTALLFLSLSPHGMEDLTMDIRTQIEQFAKNRNFEQVMIVDTHNAMGDEISKEDSEDLLIAAKSTLDTLKTKQSYPFKFGYQNSNDMNIKKADIAMGGIAILCLEINEKKYFVGWADANNMENGVREQIVKHFANIGYELIEICTSDTHFTADGARNKNGYFQLGMISKPTQLANWYLELAQKAEKQMNECSFEILENQSKVKVMGSDIYADYLKCMNKSMNITKVFLLADAGLFALSIFL